MKGASTYRSRSAGGGRRRDRRHRVLRLLCGAGGAGLSTASAGARDVEARSPRRIRRPRGAGPFGGKIGQGREGESNIVAMSAHAGDAYVGFFLRAAVQVQGKDHAAFNEPIHKARPYLISDMV
jgi:hypothetical protein